MSHPDEGILQELLDGELPPADAAAVRAHLAGCIPCAVILRDLGATQAEADAIVARLPLEPPLAKPATRGRPRRTINLRLIGLAASAVLVAGTSWMLLRPARDYALRGSNDSSAGLAPMPTEERQEVPATTPSAPPAPAAGARADRNAGLPEKAKQAPLEKKVAVAPAPAAKMTDASGVKDIASPAGRDNAARQTDAKTEMMSRVAPPAAAARLSVGASIASEGTVTTAADAEARIGTRLRTISGLTPASVEMVPHAADSTAVRQRYLVGGVTVVLVQVSPVPARDELTLKPREPAYDVTLQRQPENRGCGFIDDCGTGPKPTIRVWEAWGSLFELGGALPADSIDALMKRVK